MAAVAGCLLRLLRSLLLLAMPWRGHCSTSTSDRPSHGVWRHAAAAAAAAAAARCGGLQAAEPLLQLRHGGRIEDLVPPPNVHNFQH